MFFGAGLRALAGFVINQSATALERRQLRWRPDTA
jgi:ABC-type nitrate/sulfonate/bicarbonate transport system permease component